jgi:hypothetical protein
MQLRAVCRVRHCVVQRFFAAGQGWLQGEGLGLHRVHAVLFEQYQLLLEIQTELFDSPPLFDLKTR